MTSKRRIPRSRFENRLLLLALSIGGPATITALALVWQLEWESLARWAVSIALLLYWLALAFTLRHRVVYSLRTTASLLESLRQEDYSLRGRVSGRKDALNEVFQEINWLSEALSDQRLSALEASALLRTVMAEIDVAVFTFDPQLRLQLVNRAGERILSRPASRLLGESAAALGLEDWLHEDVSTAVDRAFPGAVGRWGVRRMQFRRDGVPHHLLVIHDLSRTLRQEERQTWQRLIRVLGHELNNSLGPIKSSAETLQKLVSQERDTAELREDLASGLEVIRQRSGALSRFMASYAQLARLPPPVLEPIDISEVVEHVVAANGSSAVRMTRGPDLAVRADRAQIEQALINLLKNAVEAAEQTNGAVDIRWAKRADACEVQILDEGPGLSDTENLFAPFFTTKPGGSGIGLVLSRQIAEAHGGSLTLQNRKDAAGCTVTLRVPLAHAAGFEEGY